MTKKKETNEPKPGMEISKTVNWGYLPGNHYYDQTPEGKDELQRRTILAQNYQPGDELLVDYIFGTYGEPIPANTKVTFLGWVEYEFKKNDENLLYILPPDNQPGIFRRYGYLRVNYQDQEIDIDCKSVTLADEKLAQERIAAWGDKEIPTGFVRDRDLPE